MQDRRQVRRGVSGGAADTNVGRNRLSAAKSQDDGASRDWAQPGTLNKSSQSAGLQYK